MPVSFPLPPGSTIGVLGGGQLGRMLALAAARLGLNVAVLEPAPDCPASRVAARTLTAAYDDEAALQSLAKTCQMVTFEFENVPAAVVERLQAFGAEVAPGPLALATAQDRAVEKAFCQAQGLATAEFAPVGALADIVAALPRLGPRALLKTRRDGYDGKGQAWIERPDDAEAAFARVGGQPAILEAAVPFVRELSVIAARGRGGEIACYPPGENRHEGGVLRRTLAPADISPATAEQAMAIARAALKALDYVGVLGVELFELADGKLLVNEFAPRVHNSGHWTLDGCAVDQFEQHVRAICGWPLGPTAPLAKVEMENLLGEDAGRWAEIAAEPDARLWLYGKTEARPGRKMGHVNRMRSLG